MMRLFDIKTNILPRIDPNCDSISESLNFLRSFKERNLEKVCSSPNFFDVGNNYLPDIMIDLQKEASKLENFEIPDYFNNIPDHVDAKNYLKDQIITEKEYGIIQDEYSRIGFK